MTPRQKLVSAHEYLRAAEIELRDHGSKNLGRVQEYADAETAKEFTSRFNMILDTSGKWQAAYTTIAKAVNAKNAAGIPDDKALEKLSSDGFKLGRAIIAFNRAAWWESPSTALLAIKAPFQVAGAVAEGLGKIVLQTGQSLVSGLNFFSKNLVWIAGIGAVIYFGWPFIAKHLMKKGEPADD